MDFFEILDGSTSQFWRLSSLFFARMLNRSLMLARGAAGSQLIVCRELPVSTEPLS
jgi:hypothetical protein